MVQAMQRRRVGGGAGRVEKVSSMQGPGLDGDLGKGAGGQGKKKSGPRGHPVGRGLVGKVGKEEGGKDGRRETV